MISIEYFFLCGTCVCAHQFIVFKRDLISSLKTPFLIVCLLCLFSTFMCVCRMGGRRGQSCKEVCHSINVTTQHNDCRQPFLFYFLYFCLHHIQLLQPSIANHCLSANAQPPHTHTHLIYTCFVVVVPCCHWISLVFYFFILYRFMANVRSLIKNQKKKRERKLFSILYLFLVCVCFSYFSDCSITRAKQQQ